MCDNVFKNEQEQKRREEFTRLFAILAANHPQKQVQSSNKPKIIAGK